MNRRGVPHGIVHTTMPTEVWLCPSWLTTSPS